MNNIILIALDEFVAAMDEIGDGFSHNSVSPTDMTSIKNTYVSSRKPFNALNRVVDLLNSYHSHVASDAEKCKQIGLDFQSTDQGYYGRNATEDIVV